MSNTNSIEGGHFLPKGAKSKVIAFAALGIGLASFGGCGGGEANDPTKQAFNEQKPITTEGGTIYPRGSYTLEQLDNSKEIDIDVNPSGESIDREERENRLKKARVEIENTPSTSGDSNVDVTAIEIWAAPYTNITKATVITDRRAKLE